LDTRTESSLNQIASDVHFLTAPLRFIWRSILWFIFLFFAPAILLVVPLALVHFFPGDDAIGLLKVLLAVLGPVACAFWLVIASAYPAARQAVREGRRYRAGLRGHLKAIAFMVIGFALSAAAMLYVVRSARDDSDTIWFIKAYLAVFSPIIMLVGWRALKGLFRKAGGI
jgi:hypothetical protein